MNISFGGKEIDLLNIEERKFEELLRMSDFTLDELSTRLGPGAEFWEEEHVLVVESEEYSKYTFLEKCRDEGVQVLLYKPLKDCGFGFAVLRLVKVI